MNNDLKLHSDMIEYPLQALMIKRLDRIINILENINTKLNKDEN